MSTATEPDQSAFRLSLPVLFGYIPLGMAFGVLFSELGYHWLYAALMGLVIYAGAGQFMAVGLLANHAGLVEVFVATLLLNARHMVYGLSLLSNLTLQGSRRWYLIYALTDETYSLLTMLQAGCDRIRARLQFRLALLNHLYWVIGCTLGAWLGGQISFSTAGIEFTLPALFLVLTLEQYRVVRRPGVFVLALVIGLLALLISADNMLMLSIGMAVSLLIMARGGEAWSRLRIF
jgi:4-azaleucine resistance transporter AzlC